MKKSLITMMVAALMSTAFAGTATTDSYQVSQQPDFKRLSGAVHVGAGTAYTAHGYVVSRAVIQGEGYGMGAVQLAYDFGKEGFWSYAGGISYKVPFSGHTLYGNPYAANVVYKSAYSQYYAGAMAAGYPANHASAYASSQAQQAVDANRDNDAYKIGYKNIEDEFVIRNSVKYTRPMWNVAVGHDFYHGGIAGVVAKHYDGEDDSRMQEIFTTFEVTPVAWFSADIMAARTFDTIEGWWFEAHARLKAPIVGTPEDIKVAGILEYGMSWTANFYESSHNACSNGTQAFWLKLSTPWFVNEAKSFILTPSVSLNWLGKGGMKANERSHVRQATGDSSDVPFRNFAVVGDLTATYKF